MAKRAPDPIDARVDALHAALPSEFVARRNALARELAASGHPRAAGVGRLPRPTLPVWAINLAAREEARVVEALVRSGEALVTAHRRVLGGASGGELLSANRALGASLERAVASAARLARDAGHALSTSMLGRIRATLRSMAVGDAAARDVLRSGRVPSEAADDGLDVLERLAPARVSGSRAANKHARGDRAAPPRALDREAKERTDRERAAKERLATEQAARGRAVLENARRSARSAERDLGKSEASSRRLSGALERARHRASEVEHRLQEAEASVEDARRRLEEARRLLSRLEGR